MVSEAASDSQVDVDNFWCDVQREVIAQGVVREGCPNPFRVSPSLHYWAPFLGPQTRASLLLHNTEARKVQQDLNTEDLVLEDVVLQLLAGEKVCLLPPRTADSGPFPWCFFLVWKYSTVPER